jgi:hypothetical protein
MRITIWLVAVAMVLSAGARVARADVWDVGGDNDNDSGSDNELVHGVSQVHDMAARQNGSVEDVDWYPVRYACDSSFEVLLDSFTGDVSNGTTGSPAFDLIESDGTTVTASSLPVSSLHVARRITHRCAFSDAEAKQYVRVRHPHCGLACTSQDQYRIRFRTTTAFVSHFNNSTSQDSILMLQNATSAIVALWLIAYDSQGAVLDTIAVTLPENGSTSIDLATVHGASLAGKSGALKLAHDAPYGALTGKLVTEEAQTGFTFDTPVVYLPY